MLQTTIQDLLGGSVDATGYRVYVVKNESEVLYVGQSSNIRDRLRGHIATRGELEGSLLGKAIFENTPQSQAWGVDLYTIEDCTDLIQHYFPYAPRTSNYVYATETRAMGDFAEDALIHHFAPLYNLTINIASHPLTTPFTEKRKTNPFLKQRIAVAEEGRRRAEQKWQEKQDALVKSRCTICGEYDTWQYSSGQPCGVISEATVLLGEKHLCISLVCHDCNEIINLLETLEKKADRVRKVNDAIRHVENRKADELSFEVEINPSNWTEETRLHTPTFEALLKADGTFYLSGPALQEGFSVADVQALTRYLSERVELPSVEPPYDFSDFTPRRVDESSEE